MHGQKIFKILDFWFIDTWNNIDQLQRNGSCIRKMYGCIWKMYGCIWVGRIRAQILPELHESLTFLQCFCCLTILWIKWPFSASLAWLDLLHVYRVNFMLCRFCMVSSFNQHHTLISYLYNLLVYTTYDNLHYKRLVKRANAPSFIWVHSWTCDRQYHMHALYQLSKFLLKSRGML